jgi:hypothetical protein
MAHMDVVTSIEGVCRLAVGLHKRAASRLQNRVKFVVLQCFLARSTVKLIDFPSVHHEHGMDVQ